MKTAKEYSDTAKREVSVDVDALLAAINEISESEVHRSQNDSEHIRFPGVTNFLSASCLSKFHPDPLRVGIFLLCIQRFTSETLKS